MTTIDQFMYGVITVLVLVNCGLITTLRAQHRRIRQLEEISGFRPRA